MNRLTRSIIANTVIVFSVFTIYGGLSPIDAIAAKPLLQKQPDAVFLQVRNGKYWQAERSRKFTNAGEVKVYLEKLNRDGNGDWRLPTKSELARLFDIFDVKRNGDVEIKLEGYYWIADEEGKPYQATWKVGDG